MSQNTPRQFRLESDMASAVSRWMCLRGLSVKSEFALPWGVCDLVGVRFSARKTRQRLSLGQTRPVGSLMRLLILSRIPDSETGKALSIARLERESSSFISPQLLSKEISALKRDRFLVSPRHGTLQKVNGWAPLHTEVVAVELKLYRVSEAIGQATANRHFATHSYVALPLARAVRFAKGRNADAFSQNGIGLLGVSARACHELLRPRENIVPPDTLLQMHVVERFWRTRGN